MPTTVLKYGFCKKSIRKKSEPKVFNWTEFHFFEVTFYKIHILSALSDFQTLRRPCIIILLIIQGCSILKQTIWPRNHTSHRKIYFYEFVANVLCDDIGILIFEIHRGCQLPKTIQQPQTFALSDGQNIELKCQSERSLYGVWPLTASMEIKNVHHISLHISNSRTKLAGLDFQQY